MKTQNAIQSDLIALNDLPTQPPASKTAAVLVPLVEKEELHVLLTLRASTLRQHGGEVAFPGGMWEKGDEFPVGTALRESAEEIALPPTKVTLLGGLDEHETRRQTRIRPVVGLIPNDVILTANDSEIASIFTVPISFFKRDPRIRTDVFQHSVAGSNSQRWVPAYKFQHYEIWGVTASIIVQLMNRCFAANIQKIPKNTA